MWEISRSAGAASATIRVVKSPLDAMTEASPLRLADSPATALRKVVIQKDERGLPYVDPALIAAARKAAEAAGRYPLTRRGSKISACLRYGMMTHYFHFMEIAIILYCYLKEYAPESKLEKIYVGMVTWLPIQEAIVEALFPDAVVEIIFEAEKFDDVIYIDSDYVRSPINKFIDPLLMLAAKWGPQLRSDIYSHFRIDSVHIPYGVKNSEKNQLRCMYSQRNPPRCFSDGDNHRTFDFLSKRLEVFPAEFSTTPWSEQVRQTSKCDIMFGIHGNGLTNLLWLPPHATVVEIFPKNAHHYDYQVMCEVMGLDYFGIEGDMIFRDFSRFGPSYGHNGEVTAIVPLPTDDVLELVFSEIANLNARNRTPVDSDRSATRAKKSGLAFLPFGRSRFAPSRE